MLILFKIYRMCLNQLNCDVFSFLHRHLLCVIVITVGCWTCADTVVCEIVVENKNGSCSIGDSSIKSWLLGLLLSVFYIKIKNVEGKILPLLSVSACYWLISSIVLRVTKLLMQDLWSLNSYIHFIYYTTNVLIYLHLN